MLAAAATHDDDRAAILEVVASRAAGFDVRDYWRRFAIEPQIKMADALASAEKTLSHLSQGPIPLPLALSALAREKLPHTTRRASGSYYTDFRLAMYLASISLDALKGGGRVIDPASGSGMLLAATVLAGCESDRVRAASALRERVYACDRSAVALRGARLALASMVADIDSIAEMDSHWRQHDSLLAESWAWPEVPDAGFDLVIANPPWEKIKLSRHEFIRAQGGERHYGADYDQSLMSAYENGVGTVSSYASRLLRRYPLLKCGEPDLYRAFLELMLRLVGGGGRLTVLVPAGLIRSQSTEELRRCLFRSTRELNIVVIENRARFFSIDSRFKFLAITAEVNTRKRGRLTGLQIAHGCGTPANVQAHSGVRITTAELETVRRDLTIPEVKGNAEWRLFKSIHASGQRWSDASPSWKPTIVRELDMTRDRSFFSRVGSAQRLPVVEGRMVHQYLFGAKRYDGGTGRKARWIGISFGDSTIHPQFWCDSASLSSRLLERTRRERLGFCDITGQTNERSILAAMIPAGVVCGNKVPTISFADTPTADEVQRFRLLGLLNSFVFDWVARRIITTTVNYFLLLSMPIPASITENTPEARRLEAASRELVRLSCVGSAQVDPFAVATLRSAIDLAILKAHGLDTNDLSLIMNDFPLLDRGQPAIAGESRSSITRDFLLARASELQGSGSTEWHQRRDEAVRAGAIPYIPSEYALRGRGIDDEGEYDQRSIQLSYGAGSL